MTDLHKKIYDPQNRNTHTRPLLEYGYKLYTGYIMRDSQVDQYNLIQKRINSFLDAGLIPSDGLLWESFNYINSLAINGLKIIEGEQDVSTTV